VKAAIALGSNLSSAFGTRDETLGEAIRRIGDLGTVIAVSGFHDTTPVGNTEQPRFLNGALLLETALAPIALMRALLAVEAGMGRRREGVAAKGPRVIDLDLLLMGDVVLDEAELRLPHPAMAERAFVLEPLAEIAPDWVHPELGATVQELLLRLKAAE
jgi:2-amino-4-hydroxy-6-hydroxymethyldihydropteridine diphosphokinase